MRNRGTTPVIPGLPVGDGDFDGLTRALLDHIDQKIAAITPTMGTVTAVQGGEIVVHIDGEKISRTIGFSRAKGVAYEVGDRVRVSVTRGDDLVVDGVYGADAIDRRVRREQIDYRAVGYDEIGYGEVDVVHMDNFTRNKVENALTSIPANSVGTSQLKVNAVTSGVIDHASVTDWLDTRYRKL